MYASLEYKIGAVLTCTSHMCLRECVRVPRWLSKKALVATGNVGISMSWWFQTCGPFTRI